MESLRPKSSFVCEEHLKNLKSDFYNSKAMKELLCLIPTES